MSSVADSSRGTPAPSGSHWIYLDDKRTHEVHAEVGQRSGRHVLTTTEFPSGVREVESVLQLETPFEEPWEARVLLAELEQRLSLMGTYWRAERSAPRWEPVRPRPGAPSLNLVAHEFKLPGAKGADAKIAFHHFHNGQENRDCFLVTMPRVDLGGGRYVLANLGFTFPEVDAGDLDIVHAQLPPVMLKSSLVRESLELPKRGFQKLVEARDYAVAYGSDWRTRLRRSFSDATNRLLDGRTGPGNREPKTRSAAPAIMSVELHRAFQDERVRRLVGRFMKPEEERAFLEGTELEIRRWTARCRRGASHQDQHALSVVEAYLLTKYAMKKGRRALMDAEGGKLLRYAFGYR